MNLYMSIPTIGTPDTNSKMTLSKNSELYACYYQMYTNIFEAYYQDKNAENINNLPQLSNLYRRDQFISPLIQKQIERGKYKTTDLHYLFDCYSTVYVDGPAPTYCLAKSTNLIQSKPIALHGQAGTEFAQCLQFIDGNNSFKNAICVSSQIVSMPDTRVISNGYPLGDGAAVTIITDKIYSDTPCFKISFVGIKQYNNHLAETTSAMINEINNKYGQRDWIIIHNESETSTAIIASLFDSKVIFNRNSFQKINFGCADVFITLNDFIKKQLTNSMGNKGILFQLGRYGTIASIVLELINCE